MEKYQNVLHAANNLAAALEEAKYSYDALEHALQAYGPTKATLEPIALNQSATCRIAWMARRWASMMQFLRLRPRGLIMRYQLREDSRGWIAERKRNRHQSHGNCGHDGSTWNETFATIRGQKIGYGSLTYIAQAGLLLSVRATERSVA